MIGNSHTPSLIDFLGVNAPSMSVADQMPQDWFIVFHDTTKRTWLRWLAFGRFKHVSCFGWVEATRQYVFFDPALERNWLRVVPPEVAEMPANGLSLTGDYHGGDIVRYLHLGVVVRLPVQTDDALMANARPGLGCVRDVARVVGIRTWSLRPDALFKKCLRLGGQIMNPERMSK